MFEDDQQRKQSQANNKRICLILLKPIIYIWGLADKFKITKAHLSQAENSRTADASSKLKIEYGDVQEVQVIHEKMNMAKFIIGSNLRICENFPELNIEVCSKELQQQSTRVDTILQRTKSASALMQDILSFGGLDALRISNEMAEKDNKSMVVLTTKSQKDAQILKKITILTMVYLPASFVSVSKFLL